MLFPFQIPALQLPMPEQKISVLILAAGYSERMGRSKDSLPYGNGLTFAGQPVNADCAACGVAPDEQSKVGLRARLWSSQSLCHCPSVHAG
jgi:CTP:molybdopterin cytidylyltransferase MocA